MLALAADLDPVRARADGLGDGALPGRAARAAGRSRRPAGWCRAAPCRCRARASPRIRRISVDLPAPFGPMRPRRSPRMMRSREVARRLARSPKRLLTSSSSATSSPERSPASRLSLTLPRRSRRAARSHAQALEALHAAFVARAARLDALADPDLFLRPELVERRLRDFFGRELLAPCAPRRRRSSRDRSAACRDRARRCAW